ncbi:hypothetical protein C1H46_016428 [Malus baccata]|uniref:Uncharacterized protein n=1 Tax=Malus baccata TaxID=106549 RepID=A0A540MGS1_MALBA|nr:hypothetical protein C1H46_016428 [Malus baccata]
MQNIEHFLHKYQSLASSYSTHLKAYIVSIVRKLLQHPPKGIYSINGSNAPTAPI